MKFAAGVAALSTKNETPIVVFTAIAADRPCRRANQETPRHAPAVDLEATLRRKENCLPRPTPTCSSTR